jgi:hypothetical protein
MVFENKVLRKIFGLEKEEVIDGKKKNIMCSVIICTQLMLVG